MIAIVILGILAALIVPSLTGMRDRAREASVKSNMHAVQVAAEDFALQNNGSYAGTAAEVVAVMPNAGASMRNPFDGATGNGGAWVDQPVFDDVSPSTGSARRGITAYADFATLRYQVMGRGASGDLSLVLSSGQ